MAKMTKPMDYLLSERFNRSFTLPADPACGREKPLNVTYSDMGYRNHDEGDGAVVMFIGGLMGGRWTLIRSDDMARRMKIRLITVDRPGMGKSDPVPLQHRMETWLATFPALLAHLNIKHVALACHSGGTIYTFNTMLRHRNLLHPRHPYVAFIAPWVHPKHSGNTSMRITAALPTWAIGQFPSIARFVQTYVGPAIGFSSGLLPSKVEDQAVSKEEIEEAGGHGKDWSQDDRLLSAVTKIVTKEDISGSADEALLYLRVKPKKEESMSNEAVRWGGQQWNEYGECVQLVVEQEQQLNLQCEAESAPRPRLKIDAWHSQKDELGGQKGAKFFDALWAGDDVARVISYNGTVVPADHDGIMNPKIGVIESWLKEVARSFAH